MKVIEVHFVTHSGAETAKVISNRLRKSSLKQASDRNIFDNLGGTAVYNRP